jgi:hypothetical protein
MVGALAAARGKAGADDEATPQSTATMSTSTQAARRAPAAPRAVDTGRGIPSAMLVLDSRV